MFIESADSPDFRTIVNLNTGTGLQLIRSHTDSHGYYIWRVEAIGGGGTVRLKEAYKEVAEKLYIRLKDEWVGDNNITVV